MNNKSQLAGFANAKHLPYFLKIHNIDFLYRSNFAPSKELLKEYKNKSISWQGYEVQYKQILSQRKIIENIDYEIFKDSVLLCSEPTPEHCHRRLLAEYLAQTNTTIKIKHL